MASLKKHGFEVRLQLGMDLNYRLDEEQAEDDKNAGKTLLDIVVDEGCAETLVYLLEKGASPIVRGGPCRYLPPLLKVASNGRRGSFSRRFLEHGGAAALRYRF